MMFGDFKYPSRINASVSRVIFSFLCALFFFCTICKISLTQFSAPPFFYSCGSNNLFVYKSCIAILLNYLGSYKFTLAKIPKKFQWLIKKSNLRVSLRLYSNSFYQKFLKMNKAAAHRPAFAEWPSLAEKFSFNDLYLRAPNFFF